MNKEEYLDKIEKVKIKIGKIEKRIAKWSKGMNDEAIEIAKNYGLADYDARKNLYPQYKEYKTEHAYDNTVFNPDDWNKGPHLDELMHAYSDLNEQQALLKKYQDKYDNLDAFDKKEKIEILWKFLQDWRERAYEYYVKQVQTLKELKDNHKEAFKEYLETEQGKERLDYIKSYRGRSAEYYLEKEFDKEYYEGIDRFTYSIYLYDGKWDDQKLNKTLDAEVKAKYEDLVNRITEKAGVIQDVSNLRIAGDGSIKGIVKGSDNNVNVECTFVAGMIQAPHYRHYVNIIR